MLRFILGFIMSFGITFGIGPHSTYMRGQLEFSVCYNYRFCYGFEWVNCDKNGHNCDMERMWVIYTDTGQIPLRFLGVKRRL